MRSVTVDGVSLTVVDVTADSFSVALIPHTLKNTTLGMRSLAGAPSTWRPTCWPSMFGNVSTGAVFRSLPCSKPALRTTAFSRHEFRA